MEIGPEDLARLERIGLYLDGEAVDAELEARILASPADRHLLEVLRKQKAGLRRLFDVPPEKD